MSSTIVSQPPRFISQHHRSPPSSAHSPPPVLQGQSRSPPPPPSASSRPLAPPPKSSQAAASKPVPAHAPPQAVIAGVPVSNEYVPVQMSAEEERRRRDEVFKAEKWSVLASQHHRSEYNRLKWGDKGSRLYYVPLSIQLPGHVDELMAKQARFEAYCAAQHADRNNDLTTTNSTSSSSMALPSPAPTEVEAGRECGTTGRMTPPRDLEQEEGLEGTLAGGGRAGELEVEESAGLTTFPTPSPPPSAATPTPTTRVQDQITQAMEDQLVVVAPLPTPQPPTGKAVFSSIEAGRQVGLDTAQAMAAAGATARGQEYELAQQQGQQQQTMVCQPVKTSDTHPINISILIPPSSIPHLSPLLSLTLPPSHPPPGFDHLLSTSPSSYVSPTTTSSTKPFRLPPTLDLLAVSLTAPSVDEIPAGEAGQRRVGNFLLSSCPGKKVRLNGPVKGRGAICRDLKVDLERIRGLGVGCVVCCLDDDELNYLGAPFEEYERNAKLVGLDVLRMPMPEGLTPTSLPAFDAQIAHLIRSYTLKGIDVLSHCRGGVGRASLVAGSWAIKMGLIRDHSNLTDGAGAGVGEGQGEDEEERDRSVVESVISVLRRRRSLKAIETYEQVRWLVEYVGWLRREGEVVGADDGA